MPKFENIGAWVAQKKYGSQAKAAKALGTTQGVVSQWVRGRSSPSEDMRALLVKLGYDGPMPEPKKKNAEFVTREEYGALAIRLAVAEKKLEETKNALIGATGAIRLLATKAGLPEIDALLK